MKTLIVDGAYLFKVSSSVNADDALSSSSNISYLFLTKLRKLINENKITKCVVCWDGENSGRARYLMYRDYKKNREKKEYNRRLTLTEAQIKKEERLKSSQLYQNVRIKKYLEELFIRQLEYDEVEGDDLIAAYCQNAAPNEEIIIFTNDLDLFQLIGNDNISIYRKIKNEGEVLIDKYNFHDYFNFHYENVLTYKIMIGDTGDNIKGIKGIGEDTLFKNFPDFLTKKVLVNDILKIAKEKVKEKNHYKIYDNIVEGRDQLILNKRLMDLSKPLLTEEAQNFIVEAFQPLDPSDRNSKNLLRLMTEDKFLSTYNSDFLSYVTPFFQIISEEKNFFKKVVV